MRPEILFPLFAPATSLKGVGPRVAPLVEKLAGPIVRDVAFLNPHSLVRRTPATVADALEGEVQTFEVTIESYAKPRGPNQPWRIRCFDATGFLSLVFFGSFGASLEGRHPANARRIVSGKVERFRDELQITHPDYIVEPDKAETIPELEPVYPATAGLPPRTVRRLALEAASRVPALPEWQDPAWLRQERFPTWQEALARLHNPQSEADLLPQARHQRRLAYDELLAHQLAMAQRKAARRADPAPRLAPGDIAPRIEADLPFALTGAQKRSLAEIRADLSAGERMSRLLQGDVGSGKTVVAMLAMADVAAAGGQTALMAPTEILARQHFETLAEPLRAHGVEVVLLTGRDRGPGRAEKLAALASGQAKVAVGTHALFQDEVAFHRLMLAVIDEQHRFGVAERQRLQAKGEAVHLLAMSATPIPRTLELTVYG
ncbi:ATP-dependent DNA helicase RecG, partial [Phenylobacterium sp.]|uniref:ATP-dependent DNA helicase RecG n=1 Tax=Phenylobacterium sp. TaxID=1871053 RepID=UPI002E35D73D